MICHLGTTVFLSLFIFITGFLPLIFLGIPFATLPGAFVGPTTPLLSFPLLPHFLPALKLPCAQKTPTLWVNNCNQLAAALLNLLREVAGWLLKTIRLYPALLYNLSPSLCCLDRQPFWVCHGKTNMHFYLFSRGPHPWSTSSWPSLTRKRGSSFPSRLIYLISA